MYTFCSNTIDQGFLEHSFDQATEIYIYRDIYNVPLMELGSVFLVSSVNRAAKRMSAPSIESLRAMAGALPPIALRAPGIWSATFVIVENRVKFFIYLLQISSWMFYNFIELEDVNDSSFLANLKHSWFAIYLHLFI